MKYISTLLLLMVLFGACSKREQDQTDQIRTVPTIKVVSKQVSLPSEYVAQVRAVRNVELRARVQGYLDEILVDEGAYVQKDQVLFLINDQEYRNEYDQAKSAYNSAIAEAKIAELEVERTRLLVEKNVISKTELDLAIVRWNSLKAKTEEALHLMKHADIKLSLTKIRAPFEGIIDRIPYKKGSLIQEGEMLTSVSDNASVYVYFNVSESEYIKIIHSKGMSESESDATLLLADGTVYDHKGMIETMAGEFDQNTGSIAFRAKFPNPERLLRHGATATVVINKYEKNAVVVPQKATFEIQDKTFVFTVKNNKVAMKSISPKGRLNDFYIIKSGIDPGESVVYEGVQFLRDGMEINPKPLKLDSMLTYLPQ